MHLHYPQNSLLPSGYTTAVTEQPEITHVKMTRICVLLSSHFPIPGFDSFFTAKGTEGIKEGTFFTKLNKLELYQHDERNFRFRVRHH